MPSVGKSDNIEQTAVLLVNDDIAFPGVLNVANLYYPVAYYEVWDNGYYLDSGFVDVSSVGMYTVILPSDGYPQYINSPSVVVWDLVATETPLAVSLYTVSDTVSQTYARALATGNSEVIRLLLGTLKSLPGYVTATEIAALEARLIVVEAAEAAAIVAANAARIAAAELAAAQAAQVQVITAANANAIRGSIMRAFFKQGFQPVVNATTRSTMNSYLQAARVAIANYRSLIAAGGRSPQQLAQLERNIAEQESRVTQILQWFANNAIAVP